MSYRPLHLASALGTLLLTLALFGLAGFVVSAVASPDIESETKLLPSDVGGAFGRYVALDSDTALIGAWMHNGLAGAAYVFLRDPTTSTWSEPVKLGAAETVAGDLFGFGVAISGNTLVVGAGGDDDRAPGAGAAYVYVRDPTTSTWSLQAKLHASDAASYDAFGQGAVAIDGDTILVGAAGDDDSGTSSGSTYVFVRDPTAGTWSQQAKLLASDGQWNDGFGCSVALSADTAIVGARLEDPNFIGGAGSAYVFVRDPLSGFWSQQAKLVASDAAAADDFGWAVAIEADTAVIGARLDDDGGEQSGSAYVFVRDPSTSSWSEEAKLTASDAAAEDRLGISVAIQGDIVVVGASGDDLVGSTYVFVRDPTTSLWSEQLKLSPSDSPANPAYGSGVDLDGATILVGAQSDDDVATHAGAAYVYDLALFDDPLGLLVGLIAEVQGLNAVEGIPASLDAKLDAAVRALSDVKESNDAAAVNAIEAFINECHAQSGLLIPSADADRLIAAAQQILDLLS